MMEKRQAQGKRLRGFSSRCGVPDGMRKAEAEKLNQQAAEMAKQDMAELKTAGVTEGLDPRAEEAIEYTLQVMRQPGDKKVRLAAARQVLEWLKAKPATTSNHNINAAEAWLAEVAKHNDGDEGEAAKDA